MYSGQAKAEPTVRARAPNQLQRKEKEMEISTEIIDILHKHYHPTMHEAIADSTLIDCKNEILRVFLLGLAAGILNGKNIAFLDRATWDKLWEECGG